MTKDNSISKYLAINLSQEIGFDPYDDQLFFDPNTVSQKYADIFGITSIERWTEAFKVVTCGVGSEETKINSLVSSSLLSLLTFYQLFEYNTRNSEVKINIDDLGQFDSCLFEVRNQVITLPSCIDVLLKNKDKWLFLESKFYEPLRDVASSLEIGISYIELYRDSRVKEILESQGIFVNASKSGKLYLRTYEDHLFTRKSEKKYLYGIKQTISHLIGLVKGPKIYSKDLPGYSKDYYTGWNEVFKLYFGTILYDNKKTNDVEEYKHLFEAIFCGDNGEKIIEAVYQWSKEKPSKDIKIIRPLTYQETFTQEKNIFIDEKVAKFYELGKFYDNPTSH